MIKYILFDLDETLYPTETGLMRRISERIDLYMLEELRIAPRLVPRLRQRYWEQYGTTLRGLMLEHGIAPEAYLAFVHDIPLTDHLAPAPELARVLEKIDLEKVIFTNASTGHARRVLDVLGVAHHFSPRHIFDIHAVNFITKPDPRAYYKVLAHLKARPEEVVLVDDTARNLAPARELGMTTVWVRPTATTDQADFAIKYVTEIGRVLKTLRVR